MTVDKRDWVACIEEMHDKFKVHDKVDSMTAEKLGSLLIFRRDFLREEMAELETSILDRDAEGVVDSIIDLCVVAIGTLDLMKVDSHLAWQEVHSRNMQKQVGIKANRPNPLGLPDLVKPPGWVGPSHAGNHGVVQVALDSLPKEEEYVEVPGFGYFTR